jgi:hypothetical protein
MIYESYRLTFLLAARFDYNLTGENYTQVKDLLVAPARLDVGSLRRKRPQITPKDPAAQSTLKA